jgi:hypothetical protein
MANDEQTHDITADSEPTTAHSPSRVPSASAWPQCRRIIARSNARADILDHSGVELGGSQLLSGRCQLFLKDASKSISIMIVHQIF